MEAEGGEFQDWEQVLHHNSDSDSEHVAGDVAGDVEDSEQSCDFVDDDGGMIQNNYFSLDSKRTHIASDGSEVSSENPSWIDPAFETQYSRKISAESWSDSGSDRFIEFEGKSEVGFVCNDQRNENLGEFLGDSGGVASGGGIDELGIGEDVILGEKGGSGVGKGEEKRKVSGVVWWKLPVELLRYCVFKGPVWTVSVAAAFLGFIILGRRLYKMKKKRSALGARITMDDNKKISQFMTRAARLNDAFSMVKRVPIIRPLLPAVGVTPWPVASLR